MNTRMIEKIWPGVTPAYWADWHWQLRKRVQDPKVLRRLFPKLLIDGPLSVTPHMVVRMLELKEADEIWSLKAVLRTLCPPYPDHPETLRSPEAADGTGGRVQYPCPAAVRRIYHDRAIVIPTFACAVHCSYCFRQCDLANKVRESDLEEGLDYIRNWNKTNPDSPIRDVIVSGGDPLSLSDTKLGDLFGKIREIPGVEVVRIDTKFLTACPQRVTPKLVRILAKHVHLMCLHAVHPDEISSETIEACQRLARAGIILRSYTPLLNGVNNSRETLKRLFWRLFSECRVTPYYLVQAVTNSPCIEYFRIPLEEGIEIVDALQTELSGVCVPKYICYLPNGGGKVELGKQTLYSRTEEGYWLRSPITGKPALYPAPAL